MTGQVERAERLRALHTDHHILVLVNVWDVASARAVGQVAGCTAIATASAAIARSFGYEDGEQIPADIVFDVLRRICAAVPDLPVTADLERGYGDVARTIEAALASGVVGFNLEDDLCPVDQMAARVAAAADTNARNGIPAVINARTDVFLRQDDHSEDDRYAEARDRGLAYLAAGADCVFVPGAVQEWTIRALVDDFGPGRLSLLAYPRLPDPEILQSWGVARVSHGPFPHAQAMAALSSYAGRQFDQP